MTEEMLREVIEITDWKARIEKNDCKDCSEKMMREDCTACGPGMEPELPKMALVGMDAVALFPSLSGRKTGEIIRSRVSRSPMQMDGFNWKRGMVYIKTNKSLVSKMPKEIKKYLPLRKSSISVEPGMSSKSLRNNTALENQWYFVPPV